MARFGRMVKRGLWPAASFAIALMVLAMGTGTACTGQELILSDAGLARPESMSRDAARRLLVDAAREQGLNPNFVLAVSYWESGYDNEKISSDGAVGLMQIMPGTAEWAGPALLGRRVDLYRARDNARLGAALLAHYVDVFGDPKLALAAYYQGEQGTRQHGIYPSSRDYVDGIWALRNRFQAANEART